MDAHSDTLSIAYYTTSHGYGHATRSLEICKHLVAAGHTVTVATGVPPSVFTRELTSDRLTVRHAVLDTGSKQLDAFTVDQRGSLEAYVATAGGPHRENLLEQEVSWLRESNIDLVVSDIVPLACAAASLAGIPCVCVSNFSFDFIFSEYLTAAGSEFRKLVWQIADDYASALCLLRLPGHVPMPAFREIIDVPLVVRHARRSPAEVRAELGLSQETRLAVFIYGGQPPGADWTLKESCLPPGWMCVVCSGGKPPGGAALPGNFILAAEDAYTPDLIGACDVVLGKIGYGTTSECLAHRKPLVFLRRDFFNEEPFLRKLLELHDSAVELKRRDFLSGNWSPYLERALALKPNYTAPTNGAEVVASLLERTAWDYKAGTIMPTSPGAPVIYPRPASPNDIYPKRSTSGPWTLSPNNNSGRSRLRDTIAWGYVMARHESRGAVDVPEWYSRGQLPAIINPFAASGIAGSGTSSGTSSGSSSGRVGSGRSGTVVDMQSPTVAVDPSGCAEVQVGTFTVLEGPLLDTFPDILHFLSSLESLESSSKESAEGSLPETRAAAGLFDWDTELFVSRAPGRLDVMGGIADYSGSTVLQMPIQEAAHVALQLQPPEKQRLWRHQAARAASTTATISTTTASPQAALRIVSLNADATNRGPAFDMDLSEFLNADGEPLTYSAARDYFKKDPALSWAAYVAGALVVLMRECGVRPSHSLAMLVSSAVPEGKGVSSSAALEVASMTALAAAHGVELEGRRLALLCQMVENLIVGAPCGVMDQMASALGEAGWLLALRCQPAEVEGKVPIPSHLRFWGVDSGIRHSVGGSDYGAVRAGAFMGLRIASQMAAGEGAQSPEPLGGGYLSNLAPSEFSVRYEPRLPDTIHGSEFLTQYKDHWDSATVIHPNQTYAVRVPTAHPVYENFRVQAFRQVLAARGTTPHQQMEVLGELMLQSHASYGRCGLGSEGTDRLVGLVLEEKAAAVAEGRQPALYGAKITGGGCGGTVCIMGTSDEAGEAALQRVLRKYAEETGYTAQVFSGTSDGAVKFGALRVRRKSVNNV